MRNLLNFVSKITLIFGICIICQASLFAQNYPQDVDLKISLDTELPPVIKINGVFAVQANVSLDANSSTIPSGETIRARIELLDPDGIAIDSYEQTWDKGFTANTDGRIQNDPLRVPGKVLFQIPWSQADKWTADTEWKILIQVFAPSVETDLSDNIIERKFPIVVPDLVPTIESISAVDPLSGELSTSYVPNTNYQVSGRITNVGQVSTQPGVYIPVLAKLLNENGSILDEEIILLGGSNQFNYIESNGAAWEFTIDELFVPPTETGVLSLSLEVNPNTLPGGAAHIEQDYSNNSVSQNVDLNIDNQANENQRPKLIFVPNSYLGERGTFRGMDPAFISFAVRNSGRAPVGPNDYAKASIFLSKDLVVDKGDFVIREFNLSGDGIGLGLLAGDTINLTWNQQLPDNYEGDFYLLIQIENGFYENKNTTSEQLSVTTIETTQLDTTPVFTLLSENHGETRLLLTDPGQSGDSLNQLTAEARGIEQQKVSILTQKAQFPELGYAYDQQIIALNEQLNEVIAQINALASPAERPDVSKDGRFLVFEKKSPIGEGDNSSFPSQQIYLLDMMQPDLPPVLITRRYGTNANPEAANGNSLRPRISYNGDTVVFHSIANNLVPGDTNNKEDVFVYRISTQTMFRAVNSNNEQFNGRSLYPAVNGDGTKIVFESDSTNADLNYSGGGSQIYLWTLDQNASGSGYIRALTKGNGESFTPSIDDKGDRIVFHSYASNLVGVGEDTNNLSDIFLIQLDSQPSYNTADFYEIQPYIDGQGNSLFQATFLVNRSYRTEQSTGGHSLNAKISGNGERIIFESKATNLVTGSGIALVEVIEGGGGYQGNPKIEIFDTPGDFNGSGAPGTGAELALKSGGINELQEIDTDAIIVIDPGTGYVSPQVRIIPDPDYPEPTLTAKAVAYLGSPEGDVYYVNVADLNGSNTQPTDSLFSHRISQSVENSGGNFGSRDASIDWNGSTILYSTKSSNLLKSSIRRDDGVNFYNSSFVLPKARAVLVGGIGEIEISSYGIGYEPGTLFIEDLSGSGSGAVASYEVDNLGRIVTIHVIDPGENYNLDSTVVSVVEPRGGTGFEAGTIRFPQTIGEGVTRQGGGRIFSVAIEEHGKGYFIGDSDDVFSDIIQFEGDGADLNQDGFPDGRLNPERLKNLDGSLYLEQRFDVDVLSSGPDLANTTLTISDKNNSNDPLVITFGTSGISSNNHIIISTLSKSEIRDEIIRIIKNELDINSSITDIERNPIIDNNLTAGTSFVFRALSGSFISSNPSAIQVGLQSNMLIMGSGYSTVTPVVNQVPSIFGFSEVLSNPQFELDGDVGRMTLLSATDFQSDDVYKYDVATAQNERISTSSFGTPVKYLANPSDSVYPSPPSNRFPVISGNGRYAFFTSDTWGNEGLAFITSNQFPQDFNPARDIYLRDLKTTTIIEEDVVSSVDILYPTNNLSHAFSAGSSIPIISDVEYSGVVGRLAVFVNQEFIGNMEEFGGGLGGTYRSGRFSTLLSGLNAGEYSLQLVAYGIDEQVLATSSLIRFEVSPYDGSLPPVITMANPSGFSAITSTSVIPISANAEDPDGTISSVSYYVDGQLIKKINRFTGVSETDQSFAMLLDINQTLADGETQGFRTIFAIAEDSSGNFVSSQIHNLSFTKGSTPPAISITRGINGFRLTAPGDLNVTRDASTKGIKLGTTSVVLTSGPIGANLIDAKVIVAGTGTGAEIVPIIDLDPLSPDYGKLTDFNVTVEGSGYDADLELSIIPIVRAINEGVRAEVDYIRNQPDDANATTRVDEIRSSVNPDGSLKLGSGYVVAPRLVIEPIGSTIAGNERLQLEQTDAPITKLLPVDLSPILPADSPANRAEIIGGFAQAPIFISIEAIPSDELIESVSLVINGEVDPELVKTFPDLDNTYNFTWVPGDIGDYSVAAIVRDFAGNIVSTEESTISVQNFYGSGVNINLGGTFEYEVEGNGQLFLQVDATSEYDVLEVEFFIDSQSVGRQVSIGSSNFQHVVDLSDPAYNFRQGEHEITIIAYDTKGNTAGTFSRTLTNLQGRINPTLNILPPLVKNKPEVSLVYPLQEIILTKGSTIRLSADANDSNGDLHGVQFYQVGSPIHAWSGKLDFNNTVPTDGRTLTLYDGTSNAPITFEFDDDFSVFGGGAPAAVPSQSNELNDLSVEGNFTYFKPVDFFVEIHQLAKNGDGDRFRWSLDGGLTFVEEYVEISAGASHSLAHGLVIKFTKDDGHAVGDRWSFTGRPLHQIVRIEDVGSTAVDVRLTRDNLEEAINEIASMGLLSVRSFTDSNYSNLYLTHTFDRLIEDDVDLSGTALSSAGGSILFTNNDLDGDGKADDFILSQASDPTRNQPFGMTWEANTTGSFILFAVAEDSDGNRQNSNSTIVTVISSVGELPHVELGPVEESMVYSGSAVTASLSAEADDPDGTIAEVSFYGNGVLIESDSTRPYSTSFEINATGHYEVYAVARDNSGNLVTSNVRRIVVNEITEEPEQPLVLSASTAYLGGVGEISATYKSPSGVYDSNIRALVYIDGSYAGDADLLPRTPPALGEEDPGQGFAYDLPARSPVAQEIEFIIINGAETSSATQTLSYEPSPLSDDLEFLNTLFTGMFNRMPESFELGEFYFPLRDGDLTREQIIEQLSSRNEFLKARNMLLAQKTIKGDWKIISDALEDFDPSVVGEIPGGSANIANRPDDSDNIELATPVGWNAVIQGTIDEPNDLDWFVIESRGPRQDGLLNMTLLTGHPGVDLRVKDTSPNEADIGLIRALGDQGEFLFGRVTINNYNDQGSKSRSVDLRDFPGTNYKYHFRVVGNQFHTGPYTIVLENDIVAAAENQQEILANLGQVTSPVKDFNLRSSLNYLVSKFEYTDKYGAIGTHNPEEFFTRLFRNKYEQDPSPVQIARGVGLLTDSNFTQFQFLHDFALENKIITVGGYNYTTSESNGTIINIPNVPLDAGAFADTALVYSALIGEAPTRAEVAKITLTPDYQLRPMTERARMIMEMPAFAARYGLAMPEVDLPNVRNGRTYSAGKNVLIDAASLGADNLAGTVDDGHIREIKVLFNGKDLNTNVIADGFYHEFTIPSLPIGEYLMEVIAEDKNGLTSRAQRNIFLGTPSETVAFTNPAVDEILDIDEEVDFQFTLSDPTYSAYLEVNGRIPWIGNIQFSGNSLPQDRSTISLSDGSGKSVSFEFDNDYSAVGTEVGEAEKMYVLGTGSISSSSSNYNGISDREYIVEIDGDETGPNGHDTFRWSIDGGANFNDSSIEIDKNNPSELSAGIVVDFDSDTAYEVGDRWRIRAYPSLEIVEVGRFGSFAERLSTTRDNLVFAINRANNEGKIAIRAKVSQVEGTSGGWFDSLDQNQYGIELMHVGGVPLREKLTVDTAVTTRGSTTISKTEWLALPWKDSSTTTTQNTLSFNLNKMGFSQPILDARIVAFDTAGNNFYSEPRSFTLRDPSRLSVELGEPLTRKASIRLKSSVSNILKSDDFQILDGGAGYTVETAGLSIVSENGKGALIRAEIDELGEITGVRVLSEGSGYTPSDLVLATSPSKYRVGDTISLSAKVNDPLSELDRVAFLINGVELDSNVTAGSGGTHSASYQFTDQSAQFITVRALYGDERDRGPSSIPQDEWMRTVGISGDRINYWGWRRHWAEQHYQGTGYVFPEWFVQDQNYWAFPPPWLTLPYGPGAIPVEVVSEESAEGAEYVTIIGENPYVGASQALTVAYRSQSGEYDPNISAMVLVDGEFVGYAEPTGLLSDEQSENPEMIFICALPLPRHFPDDLEVEIYINNGDEQSRGYKSIQIKESPITDDYEFLKALWNGLFDRSPVSAEINAYLAALRNGSMTREQVIASLRERMEFINARNVLIANKTANGTWIEVTTALEQTDQPGYGSFNGSSGNPADQALIGLPYRPMDENDTALGFYEGVADDHANFVSAGTWIGMNESEVKAILTINDQDYFKIKSKNLDDEGILEIILNKNPYGEPVPAVLGGHYGLATGITGVRAHFTDGTSIQLKVTTGSSYRNTSAYASSRISSTYRFDISNLKNVDYYSFFLENESAVNGGYPIGAILFSTLNEAYLNQSNFLSHEEIDQLQIDSRVNNLNLPQFLTYQTNNFLYTDQYGAIGSHNPEEFFTRLFRNKYEQDPSPIQIARGLELLNNSSDQNVTGTGLSQLDFLENFALDNAILSVGPYNYTHNLAIPNVPLDAAAFAETALVYSALIGRAPTKTEVAKLTLTPKYELRPLAERAKMIMEMPDYAARYGLAMPEVDLPNLRNGREYEPGDPILIDATSFGADNLAGTVDDGKIREIEVYLNGSLQGSLSDGIVTAGTRYEFYQINIPNDQPAGEYMFEVVAEDVNGLRTRASASIVIRGSIEVIATAPALGEVLFWEQNVDFGYSASADINAYLEVNGMIPWRGRLALDGTDLPEDNSTFEMSDGSGRDPVIFEFDRDGLLGVAPSIELIEMKSTVADNLTVSASYLGTERRVIYIEIDGDNTGGVAGNDTFRWWVEGGSDFNQTRIEITAGSHLLDYGLSVSFVDGANNAFGDRWRIVVEPKREVVKVSEYGNFSTRLGATKNNLIHAINRASNAGKLSMHAKAGESDLSGGGGFFDQNLDAYTIELCLLARCPVVEHILINPDSGLVPTTLTYSEDLPLITASGDGSGQALTLDLNKWLAPGSSMVKTRIVAVDPISGDVTYSAPRFHEIRNMHRPYVDLIYPKGRKAVLRFKESFIAGGLDASQIEIIDPGLGYDAETIHFNFLTADGYGGELNATLDAQGAISAISVAKAGSGYARGDVIMPSAPFRYRVGEEITLRARLHDPLGEAQGVRFLSNGVEIIEPVESYGDERVISFTPLNEQSSFISGQPFFGDGRDLPPRVMPDGSFDCDWSGKEHTPTSIDWGWRRCWEQQHCHPGQYVAPPWFWGELDGYWQWPPPWLSVDSIPGGLPIQPLPSGVTAELINPSPTDPTQNRFTLGVEVEIAVLVGAEVGTVEEVRLFLDGKLLDLDLRFPQPVPGSPVGSYSRDGIYGYVWTPARPGTYELTVQATDNAGQVSEITELSKAIVVVDTDTLGAPPVVRMTEPVPGGFGDTFPDYSYGSSLFINVLAYDPDGDLEYVKIYLNGEELGEPQGRFGDTYVFRWDVATETAFFQNFVMQAVAKDNDGNVVRSGTLAGLVADNSANTRPTVLIDNVTVSNKGVELRALAEINDNTFFGGISRVQFFINGVTLDALGGEGSFFAEGLQEYVMQWKPERAGTYQIYAMAVGSVGHTGDHFTMSEPFEFELTEEHLALFASPNSGPNIRLVSPGAHIENQAIARSHLDESLTAIDENYGEITHISMISYGEDYEEEPEVSFFGGGGNGAKAEARILNGAITRVSLSDGGKNYDESLELQITPSAEFNGSQAKLEPVIRNGVITEIPILSKGLGYKSSDIVGIFDLQNAVRAGYGARAALVVDENGSVTSINILNGGQDYDLNYLRVEVTGSGYGFEADMDSVTIEDGVIHEIVITDPGSGYADDINYSIEKFAGTGGAGFGLDASIDSTDVKDGVVMVYLTDHGTGYEYPPNVIITGGSSQSFGSPFVFTQGSIVTLEAEVEDTDGFVEEVRFYGNGQLLGNNPLGGIESLTVVNFGNPRAFSEPPVISFVGGGAGTGAEAQATIDENGTLTGVQITSPGVNYTSPPAVVISPSNGVVITATVDTEIRNNARNIPGTNRWVADWNTRFAGTFNLSVEAIDDQSKSTRISTDRFVTIIPQGPSKSPRASLLGPPDLRTYTSGSKVKLFAQASDLDGSLEWLQFYINGEPYGDAIPGNLERSSARFPYSLDWEVPSAGVYSFFARAMDNSGNGVMTGISTITATTGTGQLPVVEFSEPLRVATADAVIDENGSISQITITDGGFGYVKEPEVYITGGDGNAVATVELDLNNSSATYAQVVGINITNGGLGYEENTTYVSILKGFPLIKPGGESAIVDMELRLIEKQGTASREYQPTFDILDSGTGYIDAPTVVIQGLGTGMTAEAVIDEDRRILTEIIPTNNGTGYFQTGNKVILEGGFPVETRTFKANASDVDGSVVEVTLFVNGLPLQTDRFPPYEFEWPTGAAGYYDVYFEVLDNQGNRNVSSVMRREVFYSEPPEFHLQPASTAVVTGNVDENGSWGIGELLIQYAGTGYHVPPEVVFIDPDGSGSGAKGYAYLRDDKVIKVEITEAGSGYSENAEIRLVGGLNTSIEPIRLEFGKTLPIGIYAYDPDTMINPTGFILEVNGQQIDTFITGTDPHFSFLWTPEVPGDYDIRIRGSSVDATEAYTDNLDVEVFNDSENSVRILANPSNNNLINALGNVTLLPFEIDSLYGTVDEIRVFDNGVEVGSYTAGVANNLNYEPGSGFFTFGWVPNYVGLHEITVSVKFTSGLYIFSEAYDFEAVDGLSISILDRSPGFEGYKLHMQGTSIIVEAQINQGLAPHFSEAYLYGNDIFIKKVKFIQEGFEQPTALDLEEIQQGQTMLVPYDYDPSISTFEWNFDWNVSYSIFKDDLTSHMIYPTEDGDLIDVVKVDLKVIAVTKDNLPDGIKGRVITSETKPSFVRVLDLNKPASAPAMIYKKITGNTPTDSMVRDIKSSINESTGQSEMLEFVVNYSIGADLVPMSDLIGANQVIFGETFVADSFYSEYDEWGNDLIGFIRESLQSSKYVLNYGPIYTDRAQFFGDKEGDFFTTRKDFVSRHFYNKFGNLPSISQYTSGAKKMWDARRADLYDNLSPAADFIYNLVVEPTKLVGITGTSKETYLPFMKSTRQEYVDSAKQFILLKFLDDENDETQIELEENFNQALEGVLADPSFKNNFNLLWGDSVSSEISESWKFEDWFGWFTDETFPWIYHTDLGWLYSQSNSQNSIWFYSEQFGWFWTNQYIFMNHPNLTEDQRFIFRVRAGANGWEGSWSLITLPTEANGLKTINLFDYGYTPL